MPAEPVLFVGTVGEGLWRSGDGGRQWERLRNGLLSECDVRSLAIDPVHRLCVYAGTNEGVFASGDGGQSWTACGRELADRTIWALAIAPLDAKTLLAGARPAGLFLSTNRGASWRRLALPAEETSTNVSLRYNRVTCVGFDPDDPRRYWAGVEIGGVFTSPDQGQSWEAKNNGLSSLDIHGLVVIHGPPDRRTLVASTDNGVNLSFDEGRSWRPIPAAGTFPLRYCRGLTRHAARPEVLFLGNGDGPPGSVGAALRSRDGGNSWQTLVLPGTINSTIWGFAVHPAEPQRIYAYSVSGQIFLSRNGGDGWEKLAREFGEIRALAWAPAT
jgi:photosystem II stability/assembly factor-like uncharacterized protein